MWSPRTAGTTTYSPKTDDMLAKVAYEVYEMLGASGFQQLGEAILPMI